MHVRVLRRAYATAAFGNAHHTWTSRESLLVQLVCPVSGRSGLGEASPLPGFSHESIDDVHRALEQLDLGALSFTRDGAVTSLFGDATARWVNAPPSARCALETAFLDGLCQVREWRLTEALGRLVPELAAPSGPAARPEPAHVLDIFDEGHVARALRLGEGGVSVFKVKVGRELDVATERLEQLVTIVRNHGRHCVLRLDANQSLNLVQWRAYCRRWRALPVEYLEEPCPPALLGSFLSEGPPDLPLALDETLSLGLDVLEPWLPRVDFYVCKPMYLGGFTPVFEWARAARAARAGVVVSHLLDGPVAHRMYQALADVVAPEIAAGLGRHPGWALWSEEIRPRSDDWGIGLECRSSP